jgi:hypothetical protein
MPEPDIQKLSGSLYCISAYFNPFALISRYENFCVFYQRMMQHGANVLFAEQALHKRGFQLSEIVNKEQLPVQVISEHILWQKENLLNLLLDHLPDDCDKVCWIDSDVLFQTDDWQIKICDALQSYRVVQGYSFAAMLPKGVEFVDGIDINSFPVRFDDCSQVYGYMCGQFSEGIKQGNGHPGLVWAARRDVLEEMRFYNESIMGGADLLMARATTYHQYSSDLCEGLSRFQLSSYFQWAQKWCDEVGFSVGYAPNVLYHLFHGKIANRGHTARLKTLKDIDYDPKLDLKMEENGLWNVTPEGERLLAPISSYFSSRQEG